MVSDIASGKRPNPEKNGVSPPASKRRQQSTTTTKAVANFFKPISQKEPSKMSWRIIKDSLLTGRYGVTAASAALTTTKRKVAAFDFDSTLVTSASGKVFSRDATDWKWWHGSVPEKLRQLHEKDYLIAIISNQGGISLKPDPKTTKSDQKRLADFKIKVSAVLYQLDLPISIYAATGRDEYRKPRRGMWRELLEDHDLESVYSVDLVNSFFVGDAGGRDAVAGGTTKDHSCVDRDFAANVGMSYYTPEEFFLNQEPRPFVRPFDPLLYSTQAEKPKHAFEVFTQPTAPEIILFCGSPGAGKSSFYWNHLQPLGYARVNQDILKTREKCVTVAKALLDENTSVVIDNTNADAETRGVWIKLAKKLEVTIRCVLFTASVKICEHNDTVRALNPGLATNPEKRVMLPKLAFTGFASRYREPQTSEGFAEVIMNDFELEGSDEHKRLWNQYWV